MELAAARQEGFVSKRLHKTNGTHSKDRPLVVIGILTGFGRKNNRDAVRKAWMGTGKQCYPLFLFLYFFFYYYNRVKILYLTHKWCYVSKTPHVLTLLIVEKIIMRF